jgi:putative sugar O-methyltransferase
MPAVDGNTDTRVLYDEVMAHYAASTFGGAHLTDHWQHTLQQRGRNHTYRQMIDMLVPGTPVNARIRDTSYLVDATLVDLEDDVHKRLLDIGEPDFGFPDKDIEIAGVQYSSAFINTVPLAARIIRRIEALPAARPTVLEIGGGLGFVSYQLLAYFDGTIRFIAFDIPEILIVQEWYLRNCLPALKTGYIAGDNTAAPEDADILFVNAHIALDTDFDLDAAININSFQDMSAEIANSYIGYVERHISPGGVFYFQNTAGQSTSSVPEPSGYAFDTHWETLECGLAEQLETCLPTTELRLVLARGKNGQDPDMRRAVFDFCWHGLNAGSAWAASGVPGALLRPGEALPALIRNNGLDTPWDIYKKYPAKAFTDPALVALPGQHAMTYPRLAANVFRHAQAGVIALMENAAKGGDSDDIALNRNRLCKDVAAICREQGFPRSEYWTGYLASFLYGLNEHELALDTLNEALESVCNISWKIRFARLALMMSSTETAARYIAAANATPTTNRGTVIARAETEIRLGRSAGAAAILRELAGDAMTLPVHHRAICHALAGIDDYEGVAGSFHRLLETDSPDAERISFDLIAALAETAPPESLQSLWAAADAKAHHFTSDIGVAISRALARRQVIDTRDALQVLTEITETAWGRYYELGRLGSIYLSFGDAEKSGQCFERSIALKPNNFMHYEFVGECYLRAGHHDIALRHLETVIGMKPYLRHVHGRVAYCKLPPQVRDRALLGSPKTLGMIFQCSQTFYD